MILQYETHTHRPSHIRTTAVGYTQVLVGLFRIIKCYRQPLGSSANLKHLARNEQ